MICPVCNQPTFFESPEYDADFRCASCGVEFREEEVIELLPAFDPEVAY